MTKALICMPDACANATMQEMLAEAGIEAVISQVEQTSDFPAEFEAAGADVLIYDPGLPYDRSCEHMAKNTASVMQGQAVVFCSVSADHWSTFLQKSEIAYPVINHYTYRDDYGPFFAEAIAKAKAA